MRERRSWEEQRPGEGTGDGAAAGEPRWEGVAEGLADLGGSTSGTSRRGAAVGKELGRGSRAR